jgi:UDP-glucose 4-epimerase
MKILITGGAGYIGSQMAYICHDENIDFDIFDNLSRGELTNTFSDKVFIGDLLEKKQIKECLKKSKPDVVMHFAAFAYVGESVTDPKIYFRNNVIGTLNLIDSMIELGAKKLVFSSTCATYGNSQNVPISESEIQNPINPYGKSKMYIEGILKDYYHAYNFSSIIFRYFNAAGCDKYKRTGENHNPETHLIPLILQECLRIKNGGLLKETSLQVFGDDYKTKDGSCIRDYIHVNDLCNAHLIGAKRLYENDLCYEAYNLSSGQGYSVFEVIDMCKKITGIDIKFIISDRREGDPACLIGDPKKANLNLNWHTRDSSLETIVKTAWEWMLKVR